jgi:hypothetical protein
MARNGSGTYAIPNTYSDGQTITAAVVNANFSDIGSELTNSLPRDGQAAMTGQLKAATGSVSAPSMGFGADTDTGFYRKAANTIGVVAGGVEVGTISDRGLVSTAQRSNAISVLDYIPVAQHAAIYARTSSYDATADVQAAIDAAAASQTKLVFPGGRIRCNGNLNVPAGNSAGVDLEGQGMAFASEIYFVGAAVTTGITITGTSYAKAPAIRHLTVVGASGAVQGITITNTTQPYLERVNVYDFAGTAVKFDTVIMPTIVSCVFWSNGSASAAQVVIEGSIDASTVLTTIGMYIGGGNAGCVAGLDIKRLQGCAVIGGAIESCGKLIRIDGDSAYDGQYSSGLNFYGVDLENPSSCFIEIGQGMSSNANGPRNIIFDGCTGYLSGATGCANFAVINNATQVAFRAGAVSTNAPPTGTSAFAITGTCYNIDIGAHRSSQGDNVPWVTVSGSQRKDASPLYGWISERLNALETRDAAPLLSGTTPSLLLNATQGGYYTTYYTFNASPTSITQFLDGSAFQRINVVVEDTSANTTFVHQAGTVADAIKTRSGSNITAARGFTYSFIRSTVNGMWYEI